MESLREDSAYKKLKRNPTTRVETRISSALKELEQKGYITLTNSICFSLHSPQLHKSMAYHGLGTPLWPIVSTIGSPTHRQTARESGQDIEHTARNSWFLPEEHH